MPIKIAVYTLCKNEEKNIAAWVENVRDADKIIVGDTGSDDRSIPLLKEKDVDVCSFQVSPWRFDVARNRLLERVPKDIDLCIALDFDERISCGWRKQIENVWNAATTRISYQYSEVCSANPDRSSSIISSKIHKRNGYRWIYPVHELLSYCEPQEEVMLHIPEIEIVHSPDAAKNRQQYLALMKLAVAENPKDFRLVHQLGRDYMQYGFFDRCIQTMNKAAKLPNITLDQRNACLRFIARAYGEKKQYQLAKKYLWEVIDGAPFCSAGYIEHAILSYKYEKWNDILELAIRSREINFLYSSRYNELSTYESTFFDIIALANYHTGNYRDALRFAEEALMYDKNNDRLLQNVAFYTTLQ